MFMRFLLNYPYEALVRRVRAAAKTAQVTVPILDKKPFMPPLLEDSEHVDRSTIDTCIRYAANFFNVLMGPTKEYRCIRKVI